MTLSWVTGTGKTEGERMDNKFLQLGHHLYMRYLQWNRKQKKTSTHLLAINLELGLEFQFSRTISVYNHALNYGLCLHRLALARCR